MMKILWIYLVENPKHNETHQYAVLEKVELVKNFLSQIVYCPYLDHNTFVKVSL
jgi:hypothetical protein